MNNKEIKFKIDEYQDTLIVEKIEVVNGNKMVKNERMDYVQFYELIKELNDLEVLAENERREQERRRLLAKRNNEGNQALEISRILYTEMNLPRNISGLFAIEDKSLEDNNFKYALYIQPNKFNNYAFRMLESQDSYDFEGRYLLYKNKRISFDFNSIYIYKIVVNESLIIVPEESEVTKVVKFSDGHEERHIVPFLTELIIQKFNNNSTLKRLDSIVKNDGYNHLFYNMPMELFESNRELKNRIEQIKYTNESMNWEGLTL